MAANSHLPDFRQGDDYSIEIQYPAGTNITGYKFYVTLKATFDDPDDIAVMQYSSVAGTNPLDTPLTGKCYLTVPAAVTSLAAAGSYYYDLQAIDTNGGIATLAPPVSDYKHKITVIPQVTLATS